MIKKVTMMDLAREVGCSQTQVSRVFNGQPKVSPELRSRVMEIAQKMNYRNRANNHRIRIGFIEDAFNGFYSSNLLYHVMKCTNELHWNCVPADITDLSVLNHFLFDGIISNVLNKNWICEWSARQNLPLVMINSHDFPLERICSVNPDEENATELVLKHLKELGHRKIIRVHLSDSWTAHRGRDAFLRGAAKLNLADSVVNYEDSLEKPLEEVLLPILRQGFTAIFMIHQHLALPAARIIQQAGYRIPGDISLVTYEIEGVSEHLYPAHTTLVFDYEAIVARALQELHRRIRGREVSGGIIGLPNRLIVRESTGPCRRGA